MKANQFIKKHGWERAKFLLRAKGLSMPVLKAIYKKEDLVWMQRVIVVDDLMNMDDLHEYLDAYELVQMFYAKPSDELYGWENHLPSETKNALREAVRLVGECQ